MATSRFTFPLIHGFETPCVKLEVSNQMMPHRIVCDDEMAFVLGPDYKDMFLASAESERNAAEEETDESERSFRLEQAAQLHDIATKGLADYVGNVELSFRRAQYIPRRDALKLLYPPGPAEIELEIDVMKNEPHTVAEIEKLIKEADPEIVLSEDVLRPTYEETAKDRLIARGKYALVGLPDETQRAIREDLSDVCHIGMRCIKVPNRHFHQSRRISFTDIRRALQGQKSPLVFTGRYPDSDFRGNFVCFIEPPAPDYDPKQDPKKNGRGRGLVVFFRTDLLVKILETKHRIAFSVMPTLLQDDLWPAGFLSPRGRNAPAAEEPSSKEPSTEETPAVEDLDDEEDHEEQDADAPT